MTRTLVSAFLLMLLIWGSACTTAEPPALPSPPMPSPEAKAQLGKIEKAKMEVARYELQLWEEQLAAIQKAISSREQSAGAGTKTGVSLTGSSDYLLAKRDNLEEKVIQAKVKVRELELLASAQK